MPALPEAALSWGVPSSEGDGNGGGRVTDVESGHLGIVSLGAAMANLTIFWAVAPVALVSACLGGLVLQPV